MTVRTLGEPVTDEAEASLMQAEYGLLLNKIIPVCEGTQPGVAIAATISAGFCIAVDHTPIADKESARKYLEACVADAFAALDRAFEMKAGAENGDASAQPEGAENADVPVVGEAAGTLQ